MLLCRKAALVVVLLTLAPALPLATAATLGYTLTSQGFLGSRLAVFDVNEGAVLKVVPLGLPVSPPLSVPPLAVDLAVSTPGHRAFALAAVFEADFDQQALDVFGYVVVIDTKTHSVESRIPLSSDVNPLGGTVATSPDARRVFVTTGVPLVTDVIDVAAGAVVARIEQTCSSFAAPVTVDGTRLYCLAQNVECCGGQRRDGLRVIDLSADPPSVRSLATFDDAPTGLAISPDGSRLFVGSFDRLTIVDAALGTIIRVVDGFAEVEGQVWPLDISVSPDGTRIYRPSFSRRTADSVAVLDAASGARLARIAARGVARIALTPDGTRLLLVRPSPQMLFAARVSIIDASSNAVLREIDSPSTGTAVVAGGESCDGPLTCICSDDADCDDGDNCTVDRCEESVGCVHDEAQCSEGFTCVLERLEAGAVRGVCPSRPVEKRLDRARERVLLAQHAMVSGARSSRVRRPLRRAQREVRRAIATSLRGLARRGGEPTGIEGCSPFEEQLVGAFGSGRSLLGLQIERLRAIRSLARDLSGCRTGG